MYYRDGEKTLQNNRVEKKKDIRKTCSKKGWENKRTPIKETGSAFGEYNSD